MPDLMTTLLERWGRVGLMESPKKETAQLSKRESKLALSLFPSVPQKPIFYERAVIFFLDPINPLPFRWYVLRLQRSRAAPQPRGSLIRLLLLLLLLQPPTDSFSFWFLLAPFCVCGGGSFVRLPHDNASLLPPPPPSSFFREIPSRNWGKEGGGGGGGGGRRNGARYEVGGKFDNTHQKQNFF